MPGLEGISLGRYRIKHRLGRGGMAEVYLATDDRMNRDVAIKVVRSNHVEFAERFTREAQAMGNLHHDHILSAYDAGEQDPWTYLVMPYVAQGTLGDLLQKGPLSLEHAGELLQQIASGLQYAHQQKLLHRDIKPSNILLRDEHYVYLSDFGLARAMEGGSDLTQTGTLLGTPEYMAPELSEGPATASSDIYALAIVLYQMICGRSPFKGDTAISIFWKHVREAPPPPSTFNPKIPPAVDKVLMRALEKDPRRRYATPMALSQAYQEAISGLAPMPSLYDTELIVKRLPVASAPADAALSNPNRPPLMNQPVAMPTPPQAQRSRPNLPPLSVPVQSYQQTTDVMFSPPTQITTPPPRRKRRTNRVLGGIIIGLVFLLLVSILLVVLTVQGRQQTTIQATQTTRANATNSVFTNQTQQVLAGQESATAAANANASTRATAAAQASATSSAQANASATASAQTQASATAVANNQATATAVTSTPPLLSDTLSQQDGNIWDEDGTKCLFNNSSYIANVDTSDKLQPCLEHQQQFDNVAIQVNVTLVKGESAGLIFRARSDGSRYYEFSITSDGKFHLRYFDNGQFTPLIDDTSNSAILTTGNSNTLLVIAKDKDFKLYANGTFVGETQDNHLSKGIVGVVIGTGSSTSGQATFDMLNVYQA